MSAYESQKQLWLLRRERYFLPLTAAKQAFGLDSASAAHKHRCAIAQSHVPADRHAGATESGCAMPDAEAFEIQAALRAQAHVPCLESVRTHGFCRADVAKPGRNKSNQQTHQ